MNRCWLLLFRFFSDFQCTYRQSYVIYNTLTGNTYNTKVDFKVRMSLQRPLTHLPIHIAIFLVVISIL